MKNKTKVISIVLSFSVFFMFVSCQKQKAEWKGTIEKENGVTIVKNPEEPMYGEDIFSLEEELSIGKTKGLRNDFPFALISGIAVDEEGNIYIVDYKEKNVKVFGKNGNLLKTIGREGQGPGEFQAPFQVFITSHNEIVVWDSVRELLVLFSLDGNYLRNVFTQKTDLRMIKLDSHDNIVGMVFVRKPENPSHPVIELRKLDSNLDVLFSLGSRPVIYRKRFVPNIVWELTRNDDIVYGYSEWIKSKEYRLKIFNPKGKLIKEITKEYEPLILTEENKRKFKESIPSSMELNFPKYYSPFRRFLVDNKNRIYVQTWEGRDKDEVYYYDVFDVEGRYIAKVPIKNQPVLWKNNKLYSIEEDEEGFQVVKQYKVSWRY